MVAVADLVSLEVQTPVAGVFVLNRSVLGGPDVLATGTSRGLEWTPVLCDGTGVHVRRGGRAEGVSKAVEVGTLNASFINGMDPTQDPNWRPGVGVRLVIQGTSKLLFTGTTADFSVTYDKDTDNAHVAMTAVDAVRALANTTRYGAANPVAEFEPWNRRAERVLQSSPVDFVPPQMPPAVNLGYTASPSEAAFWSRPFEMGVRDLAPVLVPSFTSGSATRTLGGLTIGRRYRVSMLAYALLGEHVEMAVGSSVVVTPGYSMLFEYGAAFVATRETHTLSVRLTDGSGAPEIAQLHITSAPSDTFQASNNVYESSLLNHLTLAANTGDSGWFVDKANRVRFADDTPVRCHFSDVHTTDPLHVCYTEADTAYGTRGIVNTLSFENHARQWDADSNAWVADDHTLGAFEDGASQATWGQCSATLETSLWAAGDYLDADAALVESVLSRRVTPRVLTNSVRFDATAYPDTAAELEIYDKVTVKRGTHTGTYRIIALEHDIQTDRWFTTITLIED